MTEPAPTRAGFPDEPPLPHGIGAVLTLANLVTLARLAAAPLLAADVQARFHASCGLLFVYAVATDLVDGRLARRRGEASRLGGLFDHATDAIFVATGLGALAKLGLLTPLLPALVLLSFLQYVVDSRVHRGLPLRASSLGRVNGISYYVLLGTVLIRDALALGGPSDRAVAFLAWTLVATTVVSMADRAVAWRRPSVAR
ncbi:MAG TPA: CDP-alcohol phosphatidyltransferase family protein [Myxococcota bacterium]|jgi:phosphatidylglycerophosphate synthase|nr:CDP-alcohol phosphatidyltransferase family protein [Myxococcota bacterium]